MRHSKKDTKNTIALYSYCLDTKFPLPVLGNNMTKRHGFLLLQKTDDGYRIGEAAPLPSFHHISFQNIQEELMYFVTHQKLPQNSHSLSQFAVDMLDIDELYTQKNTHINRKVNGLYHDQISKSELKNYRYIKIKVGRTSQKEDLHILECILEKNPNIRFRLDPNCLWTYTDTLDFWNLLHTKAIHESIEYIEDPVQHVEHLPHLSHIPVALDMLFSPKHLKYNPKAIIVKPTLQGGWRAVQKMQQELQRSDPKLQIIISSTFESSIGIHAMMHLADPLEYHGLDTLQYFLDPNHDLLCQSIEKKGDRIRSSNTFYHEEDLRWDLLEKL